MANRIHLLIPIAIVSLLVTPTAATDTLTVFEVYRKAEEHFILSRKHPLSDRILALRVKNLERSLLPSLTAVGTASYQSEVPELPFTLSGQEPLDLPHEKIQAYIEAHQHIYDGGVTHIRRSLELQNTAIEKQHVAVSLQQLKHQVIQLYFEIVVTQQRGKIIRESIELLRQKLNILEDAYAEGISDEQQVFQLRAEILVAEQSAEQNDLHANGIMEILSILTGMSIDPETAFHIPAEPQPVVLSTPLRPELQLITLQQEKIQTSIALTHAMRKPVIRGFGQGGLGYPNPFNLFDDALSPFFIAGVRATWNLTDRGNAQREQEMLLIQSQMLEVERDDLLQSIDIRTQEYLDETARLTLMLSKDRDIMDVRKEIRVLASQQFDHGIIDAGAFIEALSNEESARLNFDLHTIQLSLARANFLNQQGMFFNH